MGNGAKRKSGNFNQKLRTGTMGKVQIAVLANCQARPVADLLRSMNSDVEITSTTIVHLAKDAERDQVLSELEKADYIFAQGVQENYPISFVRTQALRNEFGDRLVTWPNIFFKGQCPDICYFTKPRSKRVLGVLGEYQNQTVYEAWCAGLDAEATRRVLLQGGEWTSTLSDTVARSFAELKAREAGLDVAISEEIQARWKAERLFYTFNHPVNFLLAKVAASLLARVGANCSTQAIGSVREPLDRIIPPVLPPMVDTLGLAIPVETRTKGYEVEIGETVRVVQKVAHYDLEAFIDLSFKCFEAQITRDEVLRRT